MKPTLKQIRAELKKIGNFRIAAMSGGYVALYFGATQLAAWVTPEQAVAMAQDCANTVNGK